MENALRLVGMQTVGRQQPASMAHQFDDRVNPALNAILANVGNSMGVEVRVSSGFRGPGGSGRHNGDASDAALFYNGRHLSVTNPDDLPIIQEFTRRFSALAGQQGFTPSVGWANHEHDTLYMGGNYGHFDIAVGNSIGADRGRIWGGSGARSAHVPAPSWLHNAVMNPGAYDAGPFEMPQTRMAGLPNGARPTAEQAAMVERAAREAGVDPNLFMRLVAQESAFSPDVWSGQRRSSAGAIGPAQLMPGTAAELGVDPYDQYQNLLGGARYLRAQMDAFGQPDLALAAYNAGPGRVRQAGGIPNIAETQNYVASILGSSGNYTPTGGDTGGMSTSVNALAGNPMMQTAEAFGLGPQMNALAGLSQGAGTGQINPANFLAQAMGMPAQDGEEYQDRNGDRDREEGMRIDPRAFMIQRPRRGFNALELLYAG